MNIKKEQKQTWKKMMRNALIASAAGLIIVYSLNTLFTVAIAATASSMIIGYLFGKADGYRKGIKELGW